MKAMGASRGLHWCEGNCVRRIREGCHRHYVVGGRDAGRWTTLGQPDKRLGDDSEYGATPVEGLRLSGGGAGSHRFQGVKWCTHTVGGGFLFGGRGRGVFSLGALSALLGGPWRGAAVPDPRRCSDDHPWRNVSACLNLQGRG